MNIATTYQGIEDITAEEVKGKQVAPGRIAYEGKQTTFTTVIHTYQLIKHFTFTTIEDIEQEARGITYNFTKPMRAECERHGNHNFNSVDVEKAFIQVLRTQGKIINYKQPEEKLFIDIIDNNCFIGIPLVMHQQKRTWRMKINNQGTNAVIAAAMVTLAHYQQGQTIIDPYSKDGTLLIEAATKAPGNIHGYDKSNNNIRNAEINTKLAKATITYHQEDNDWITTHFKPGEIDAIISYPPFESQRRKEKHIKNNYEQLFQTATELHIPTIVILSPNKNILTYTPQPPANIKELHLGQQTYYIISWYDHNAQKAAHKQSNEHH
ncbi:MAG TPA: THUMP domain-containing protein [Candidatus Nanoarchaeia archaeon]|nr:THUMP domain-containing protein [Candidatus Nanoarchaeia archaeon]